MSRSGRDAASAEGAGRLVGPIRRARERVRRERSEVRAEIEALGEFDERLAAIPVEPSPSPDAVRGPPGLSPGLDRTPSPALGRVREAYRETVMAVPHYERVYGESLAENLAAEFGPGLSAVLDADAPGAFTAARRDALRSAVRSVAHGRRELADALAAEADSLDDAAATTTDVATDLAGAGPHDPSVLGAALDALDALVADRQRHFADVERLLASGRELCAYLYADREWTYPVLHVCATLRERIERARLKP